MNRESQDCSGNGTKTVSFYHSDHGLHSTQFSPSRKFKDDFARHLSDYTSRTLTHQYDIYNAFTGILDALYGDSGGCTYGLPRISLDQALLWCPYSHGFLQDCTPRIISGMKVPTWSWASVQSNAGYSPLFSNCPFLGTPVKWHEYHEDNDSTGPREICAIAEAKSWKEWRDCEGDLCPPLYLRIAICEGCFESELHPVPNGENTSPNAAIKNRWPLYTDFLHDVVMRQRGIHLPSITQDQLRHGVLFTRTQSSTLSVSALQSTNLYFDGFRNMLTTNGQSAGELYDDYQSGDDEYSQHENELLTIEVVALSLSAVDFSDPSWPFDKYLMQKNEIVYTDGQMETGLNFKEQSSYPEGVNCPRNEHTNSGYAQSVRPDRESTTFSEPIHLDRHIPFVNVMHIGWRDGYAHRIGIGWIWLKYWAKSNRRFKDIYLE